MTNTDRLRQLQALLIDAMGADELTSIDLRRVDFALSMRQNGFDSLTQVAVFSIFEERTGSLPVSAEMTMTDLIACMQADAPDPSQKRPT